MKKKANKKIHKDRKSFNPILTSFFVVGLYYIPNT